MATNSSCSSFFPADFTHLRVHSNFTLMGATASVDDLVSRASAEGFTSLALTDANALYGAVAFSKACDKAGVQPILGMTITLAQPADGFPGPPATRGRLVLLATGLDGYRSLCRLSALILGDPRREPSVGQRLQWDELRSHRQGLICMEGGREGWIEHYLRAGNMEAANDHIARLVDIYGENCYLSLEIHQTEDQTIAQEIMVLGQRFGLPPVAVQPVYLLEPQDRATLRLLAAIHHNVTLDQLPTTAVPGGDDPTVDLHWLSKEEMADRLAMFPTALTQVGEVVRRCEPALPDGRPLWPTIDIPDNQSPDEELATQAWSGLTDKFGLEVDDSIRERLQRELDAIAQRDYAPLFLVVADIVRYARDSEIPVNTRGSVANSLVAYCIGITTVDPIAHGLLFERFLNPARIDLPDIDLDFCSRRRDEVLDYVRRTYGEDRVALVATVSTMRPKSAVGETAKAYGFDETQIKNLTARLPRYWHPDPRRRDRRTVEDLLAELEDERLREVVRAGYRIVGQPRHLSVHPGGVVITPGPLTDVVPVQWAPKGFLITQFDHSDVEAIGLPKIDLLGISALTVLADAVELIRIHHEPDFHLGSIPLDDPKTGDLLSQGETIGIFQCESEGAQLTLRKLRARTVPDLAVANAFFKPGPATGGMAKAFVRRYRGEEKVTYLHPALEPILSSTMGVLIFQEQILRVAREIAGLNWEEADHLRRGMSKFRVSEMDAMRTKFVSGCSRPPPEGLGFTSQSAEKLWEQVIAFAGYGFNQGHATAYAGVSYRMAYLKTHWPTAFLCARLADRGGYHHPAIYMAEAARLGIQVRPPHVNHSDRRFTLSFERDSEHAPAAILWMGLGQVRDLRRKSIRAIVGQQEQALFSSLRDLIDRVPLQNRELTHLIQCGGLDGLGESRAALLVEAENVARAGSAYQRAFSFAEGSTSAPETPAQRMKWEQHILGLPVSAHPLSTVVNGLGDAVPLHRLPEMANRMVKVVGARLPGWTGGRGFFFSDGATFVNVKMDKVALANREKPPAWRPLCLRGRWRVDEWGSGWFQAEEINDLMQSEDHGK